MSIFQVVIRGYMGKKIKRGPFVDTHGIPLPIDYGGIRDRGDLVWMTECRLRGWYKMMVDPILLELAMKGMLSDCAFRVFCYIGSNVVQGSISYIRGTTAMKELKISRSSYTVAIGEIKKKGFMEELDCPLVHKSDRVFHVSPAYFWKGSYLERGQEIKKWYGPKGGWS